MIKRLFAGSLVLALLSVGMPGVYAASTGNLQLSPNPTFSSQPAQANEDISLRGHLSTIPKGTIMMVRVDHPISSYSSKVGDPVTATVEADVYMDNQIAIPMGSQIEGSVTGVVPAGHLSKHGELEIQFHTIRTTYGTFLPVRAHVVTADETGIIKGDSEQAQVLKTLGTAVGTTAAGTVMGTAAGSLLGSVGGGATFGVAAGALVGIGYAIVREGKQVVVPSGARMSVVLDQPIASN